MNPIKVTIHGTGSGPCSLTGKEGNGLTITFDDGTLRESFLSWRAFQQLLSMKAGRPKPTPTANPVLPANSAVPAK